MENMVKEPRSPTTRKKRAPSKPLKNPTLHFLSWIRARPSSACSSRPMSDSIYRTEVAIVGGGIAGITTALELLEHDCDVLLLDRDRRDQFGGLARWSFGGIFFVDTPQQRFLGIDDSPELALQDWHAFAEFEDGDMWPRRWAEQYVHRCTDEVYRWLHGGVLRPYSDGPTGVSLRDLTNGGHRKPSRGSARGVETETVFSIRRRRHRRRHLRPRRPRWRRCHPALPHSPGWPHFRGRLRSRRTR